MAESKIIFKVTWENNKSFIMTSQKDDDSQITVIRMDENSHLNGLSEQVATICNTFFSKEITKSLEDMKKP